MNAVTTVASSKQHYCCTFLFLPTQIETFKPSGQITHSDPYFNKARKAAGSTSGSSISVEVVAIPPLNIASNTALPTARTNLPGSAVSNNEDQTEVSHFATGIKS